MSTDKLSAIEAAAKALWPTADISDFMLHALRESLVAYLSALVEDEEAVEACKEAVVKEMDQMAAVYGSDARMFDLHALRVKSVLRTLATRAQGESS